MRPWAEIRRTRAEGLRIPALCLAVAVAAMTATRGCEQQSAQALGREARGLAGADLEVTSPRPLPEAELQCAKAAAGAGWRHASLRDFLSMAAIPGTSRSRLVDVGAWGEGYPFYGKFVTLGAENNKSGASQPLKNDPKKTAHARLKKPTRSSPTAPLPPLLTQDDLLAQLDWKPGNKRCDGRQRLVGNVIIFILCRTHHAAQHVPHVEIIDNKDIIIVGHIDAGFVDLKQRTGCCCPHPPTIIRSANI